MASKYQCRCIPFLVALTPILLTGCENPQTPEQDDVGSALSEEQVIPGNLDGQLRKLLIEKSDGEGLKFWKLPWSFQLNKIPQDPLNPLSRAKVILGRSLYHETALGVNNVQENGYETYSCASCHHAQGGFMANLPQGIGEGGIGFGVRGEGRVFDPEYDHDPVYPDCQPVRTPTSMNGAYQELMLWNGQFGGVGDNLGTEDQWEEGTPLESNWLGMHGLETQAHAGLKVHRMGDIELSRVAEIPMYKWLFRAAFRGDPDPINRLNAALAIAAYERTLLANDAPFQRWLHGHKRAMTRQEKRGALVFFGTADCGACHTGPALNTMEFYALGMNDLDGSWDPDRVNLEPFGGTIPDGTRLGRGGFTQDPEDFYKFKTPQLYNLLDSPFYGHGASFATVREVVEYMNTAMPENPIVPPEQLAEEFVPLGLTDDEVDDLVAFLEGALYDPGLMRYVPDRIPSGNCFPNNDPQSQIDLGCTEPLP